jgi:hypothetical protein
MTRQDALNLRAIDSPIDGHPNPGLGVHFFDLATDPWGRGCRGQRDRGGGADGWAEGQAGLLHHRRR